MSVLRELTGEQTFSLRAKVLVIGRDPSSDIVLRIPQVSGRHALVVQLSGGHYIEDLDSRNGTYVNGKRIKQRTRLACGDRVEVGGRAFEYNDAGGTGGDSGMESIDMQQSVFRVPGTPPSPVEAPSILSSLAATGDLRLAAASEAKLRAVLELSRSLGTTLDLKVVLPKVLESLFVVFPQADRGFILLRDPGTGQLVTRAQQQRRKRPDDETPTISKTVVDHALSTRLAILSADVGGDSRFGVSESVQRLQLCSIMCVPLLSQEGIGLGVIQLDTLDKRRQFRQEDLDVLVSAAVQAARAVELAQLHSELRDLEAATEIQKSFLPEEQPKIPGLQFFDYYSPARHVSGDYFDYIPLPGNRLAVALGDVSGKGVPASLMMARLSAAARFCLATAPSAAQATRELSAVLTRTGTEDRFVTFVVLVLDLNAFTLTIVNAGHMPPLRRTAAKPAPEEVGQDIAGVPLAVFDRPYEEATIPFAPGDTFILFTDGVTEARDAEGGFYGPDRLNAVIERAPDTVEGLGKAILADVGKFSGNRPQADDLTLVCFSRQRASSPG
jgi:serine phosphatase RsbU (regulator of sigma subunit)